MRTPRGIHHLLVAGWAGLITPLVPAAAPVLEHLFPVVVPRGASTPLSTPGTFDPWPVQFATELPGIEFSAETNKAKVTVTVARDAQLGPHLVWAYQEAGASSPRFLVVSDDPLTAEVEPNDDFRKPQLLSKFPAHVNGRLEKGGDVDCYAVVLQAGQTVIAELEAYTLMTGIDALLRLTDVRGNQVAWNHDNGRTLDPRLTWTAPAAGTYILQVMGFVYPAGSDVKLHGSEKTVYLLHTYTGPYVTHTVPLGVRTEAITPLQLRGWNLGSLTHQPFPFPPRRSGTGGGSTEDEIFFQFPGAENLTRLLVGAGPEIVEHEPNDSLTNALPIPIPGAVTGTFNPANDQDRYAFEAKKGEQIRFSVRSASLGFPTDPWLEIQDASGKSLSTVDDALGADPETFWTAPDDGKFSVVLGNRLHRGSPEHWYRLQLSHPQPDCRATVANATFALKPGTTNELKVTLNRRYGHTNKLTASAVGLPAGIQATPVGVPEKNGEFTLSLIAATNAPPFNGRFQVTLKGEGESYGATFEFVSSGENNGVPQGFKELIIPRTEQFWLTVTPPGTNTVTEPKK